MWAGGNLERETMRKQTKQQLNLWWRDFVYWNFDNRYEIYTKNGKDWIFWEIDLLDPNLKTIKQIYIEFKTKKFDFTSLLKKIKKELKELDQNLNVNFEFVYIV